MDLKKRQDELKKELEQTQKQLNQTQNSVSQLTQKMIHIGGRLTEITELMANEKKEDVKDVKK